LPLGKKTLEGICLEHRLKVEPDEVLQQVLGVTFYKIVNGEEKMLKGGAMRILEAVRMEQVKQVEDEQVTRIGGELHELMPSNKGENIRKPFTARELREMGGLFIKQLPHPKKQLLLPHLQAQHDVSHALQRSKT
jgi:hypothetical protein